jgi:sulfur carrier protein ThiS adenylyltransferase
MPSFREAFFSHRDSHVLARLRESAVGIAGAGGLGSNAAISLARAGIGRLVVADFDRVEPANLNRQQFFVDQVGMVKTKALLDNLLRINPFAAYEMHEVRLNRRNTARIFADVDVLVEALDRAAAKEMLIEAWLAAFPDRPIVAASGLSGFGANRKLHVRRLGSLYICGDEESEAPKGVSPMAPRVAIVANMQANLAVELLVKNGGGRVRSR